MTKPTVQALILEISASGAARIARALVPHGVATRWQAAATPEAVIVALAEPIDIILASDAVAGYAELPAALARRGVACPLIVVAFQPDEVVAARCIRRGAFDYVSGERLARLGEAVQDALRDQTERPPAMADLVYRHERLALAFDGARAGLWDWDIAKNRLYRSPRFLEIIGLPPDHVEVPGETWRDLIHPQDVDRVRAAIRNHFKGLTAEFESEYRVRTVSGAYCWLHDRGRALFDASGRAHRMIGTVLDCGRRKKVEIALRESETRFRDFADAVSDWQWEMDAELRFTGFIGHSEEAMKQAAASAIGKTRWDSIQVAPDTDENWRRHREDLLAHRPFRNFHYPTTLATGEVRYIRSSGKPIYEDGRFVGYRGVASDETEEVASRQRAECAEALLRDAIESFSEGFAIFDRENRLILYNAAFRAIHQNDPILDLPGTTYEDMVRNAIAKHRIVPVSGSGEDYIADRLRRLRTDRVPMEQQTADGRWYLATKRYMRNGCIAGVRIDITALKKAEEALRSVQKMEALGTLAGGIAHDLNNILVPILGLTKMIATRLPAENAAREHLQDVVAAANRAKQLVAQILDFSRSERAEYGPTDLGAITTDTLRLLRSGIAPTVTLHPRLRQTTFPVFGDPTQLHQVVMNLCTNAAHAIGARIGRIEIGLDSEWLRGDRAGAHGLIPGDYVRLTVSDDGCGMDDTTRQRIFEPFFTTKGVGEGAGMGLAIVQRVIASHGGAITVASRPGKGTRIDVLLPLALATTATAPLRQAG